MIGLWTRSFMTAFPVDERGFDWSLVLQWDVPRITCPKANDVESTVHSSPEVSANAVGGV